MSEIKQIGGVRPGAGRPFSIKTNTSAALSSLLAISQDPNASHEVRVQAATEILNFASATSKTPVGVKDGD
jgi:hypothetical protein